MRGRVRDLTQLTFLSVHIGGAVDTRLVVETGFFISFLFFCFFRYHPANQDVFLVLHPFKLFKSSRRKITPLYLPRVFAYGICVTFP